MNMLGSPPLIASAIAVGMPVFPCSANKQPCIARKDGGKGLKDATTDLPEIERMFAHRNAKLIGVPTGEASGWDALDLDYRHGARAFEEANRHRMPETRVHETQSGGRHLIFLHAPGVRNTASKIAPGVDVRGWGGYIIAPPSPGYRVISDAEPVHWPDWLLEMVLPAPVDLQPRPVAEPRQPVASKRIDALIGIVLEKVRTAPDGAKHFTLRNQAIVLGGLQHLGGFSDGEALTWLMDALPASAKDRRLAKETAAWGLENGKLRPIELEDRPAPTRSRRDGEQPLGGSLVAGDLREQPPEPEAGYLDSLTAAAPAPAPRRRSPSAALKLDAGLGSEAPTEDGVALAFTKAHHDELRYDHTRGAWFHWTSKAWRQDETKLAFAWSRRVCRRMAHEAENDSTLKTLSKAATAAAVERFAQSDRAFAVTSVIWDSDPFLLGTPGGTVDLKTGVLRPPSQDDFITRLAAVTPTAAADCPLWLGFLNEATNNDPALIGFLKRWCGYALTGDTREHALLFIFGPGGNGKSVFLNTVIGIMAEYCRTAAMETFTASQGDRHPTDLAMLNGARMVTASETEEGRAWAESRIKQLTGGDTISARFMRQDFFEFRPQFKLTVIGNNKPVLRNVDDAARRRFNMAAFVHKPASPDRQLENKLKAEWPAILRWMIDGCLDWQRNGLVRPQSVIAATAEYFSEQDSVHQWVEEACERGPFKSDTMACLFKSWTDYALANGEKPGTTKWFSQTLVRLGCEPLKNTPSSHGKRGFGGISVRPAPAAKSPHEKD